MPSLRNKTCVFCLERILQEKDAHQCEGCRNPMHYDCERPVEHAGRGECSVCGVNLAFALNIQKKHEKNVGKGGKGGRAMFHEYVDYAQVPWYRQSIVNNVFIALSLVGCFPFALWTCINLLTGDVYYNQRGADGTLQKWGAINKAWAILYAFAWMAILVLFAAMTGR